jgi:hypothetical protein
MISKPRSTTIEELKTYRCPACGEMVHNADREAVRLHHDHVLHPRQGIFLSLPHPNGSRETVASFRKNEAEFLNVPTAR